MNVKIKVLTLGLLISVIPGCFSGSKGFFDRLKGYFVSPNNTFDLRKLENKENVFPLIVIGSGPAGLSAGLYGARAKKRTLVIEGPKPGGLLTETTYVENWPGFKAILGKDIIKELREQAAHFGAEFLAESVEKIDLTKWPFTIWTDDGKTLYAAAVIIATGASPNKLNIPGETEYWGRGVTTCAICDAPFYQAKEVVVIGGGDSAVSEAIQLAPYANKITVLVRKEKMRAAPTNQELLQGYNNISVMYNVEPKKIVGNDQKVTAIEIFDSKQNKTITMPIDGVFLAIGHNPNVSLFKDQIELDNHGYIATKGQTQQTSVEGVFAAGEVEGHRYRQAGVAAGDGIKAALDADMFLNDIGFNADLEARLCKTQKACAPVEPPMVEHVASLQEFEKLLKETQNPVFVDFYADYCPSCMAMIPHFNAVAEQFKNLANFISVDISQLPDIAKKYHISKIPAILVFQDGSLVARFNNAMNKAELQEMVAKFVKMTKAHEETANNQDLIK